jgi:hypothetical protein
MAQTVINDSGLNLQWWVRVFLASPVPKGWMDPFRTLPPSPGHGLGWMAEKSLDVVGVIAAFGHYVIRKIAEHYKM